MVINNRHSSKCINFLNESSLYFTIQDFMFYSIIHVYSIINKKKKINSPKRSTCKNPI